MKLSAGNEASLAASPESNSGAVHSAAALPDLQELYDRWATEVSRWARALGARDADRDDIVQDVFLVVRRKLETFDGQNLAGWLYQITRRQVRDARRRAWVRHVFTPRRVDEPDEIATFSDGPAAVTEKRERQQVLFSLLEKMPTDLRVAFVLFEIEGRSGQEIADVQGISVNAVWSRLYHARKAFRKLVSRYRNIQLRNPTEDGR